MMVKILGQPEDYSDVLMRIAVFTGISCFICIFWISATCPGIKSLIETSGGKADFFWIKGVNVLYVVIPLAVAVVCRIIKLHDRVSDLFFIRQVFDTHHILFPMAQETKSNIQSGIIKSNRVELMYKVFYSYAGYSSPKIDSHLVRSGLDTWGWLWVMVESSCIYLGTTVFFLTMVQMKWFLMALGIVILHIFAVWVLYKRCVRTAEAEVKAIMDDPERREKIRGEFAVFDSQR